MTPPLQSIGKYQIECEIGHGGMGVVYKATDPLLGVAVAIKMITGDVDIRARFYAEARSTASLRGCPNIVTVYEFGEQDGKPYLVMEYLEGTGVEALLRAQAPLTLADKISIMIDVCNGLSYAHDRGITHRDIKPSNIIVMRDGSAKIVDFGIARVESTSRMTGTNQAIGTLEYMSPEQFTGDPEPRSDIWSAGVVLYQMLTGYTPFNPPGTRQETVSFRIMNEPFPPVSTYTGEGGEELERILTRALQKNRDERYGSAKEFALDLLQVQERLKDETVAQYLQRADTAIKNGQPERAKELLAPVFKLDRQNTQAHKVLREAEEKIRERHKLQQLQELKVRTEQALREKRYDDALVAVDQAIALTTEKQELLRFRESVVQARQRAAMLQQLLDKAQRAHQEGDLDTASAAVREGLALDPSDTRARTLDTLIRKELEQRSREQELASALEQAHLYLVRRQLDRAAETMRAAQAIDPDAPALQELAREFETVREQVEHDQQVDKVRQELEKAFDRGDFGSALAKADEGLRFSPGNQTFLNLKELAENEVRKVRVDEQTARVRALLDSGNLAEAKAEIDGLCAKMPGEARLEDLRVEVKARLGAAERAQQARAAATQEAAAARPAPSVVKQEVSKAEVLPKPNPMPVPIAPVAEPVISATQILRPGQAPPKVPAPETAPAGTQIVRSVGRRLEPSKPKPGELPPLPPARRSTRGPIIAVIVVIVLLALAGAAYFVWKPSAVKQQAQRPPASSAPTTQPPGQATPNAPKTVPVQFEVVPTDSTVRVNDKVCSPICDLMPGSYSASFEHEGYETQTVPFEVGNAAKLIPMVTLVKAAAAAKPETRIAVAKPVEKPKPVAAPPPVVPAKETTLEISALPFARVVVDGKDQGTVGQTGKLSVVVDSSRTTHSVQITKVLFNDYSESVAINPGTKQTLDVKLRPLAVIASFGADGDKHDVAPGEKLRMHWDVANASEIWFKQGDEPPTQVPPISSAIVSPTQNTTYILFIKDAAGTPLPVKSYDVRVMTGGPVSIRQFDVTPASLKIKEGEAIVLQWRAENAVRVVLKDNESTIYDQSKAADTITLQGAQHGKHQLELTAFGAAGKPEKKRVTVVVAPSLLSGEPEHKKKK